MTDLKGISHETGLRVGTRWLCCTKVPATATQGRLMQPLQKVVLCILVQIVPYSVAT